MTPEQRKRVQELFLTACELEPDQRTGFLDRACGGDETVHREIESLLRHDTPETLLQSARTEAVDSASAVPARRFLIPGRAATAPRAVSLMSLLRHRKRRWAAILAAAVLLALLGYGVHSNIDKILRGRVGASLEMVLNSQVLNLRLWIMEHFHQARNKAKDSQIRSLAEQLVELARSAPHAGKALRRAPAQTAFNRLSRLEAHPHIQGLVIMDRTGMVIGCSWDERLIGMKSKAFAFRFLVEVLKGSRAVFVPPARFLDFFEVTPESQELARSPPAVGFAVPLLNRQGEAIAALISVFPAEKHFTEFLNVARFGTTGETYAFSPEGMMLSESRFRDELKRVGLIPNEPDAQEILSVRLVNPGADLRMNPTHVDTRAQGPLTQLVRIALAEREQSELAEPRGVILDPYRNYLGAEVIGAWRWLPEYDFGIATELDAAEAYVYLDQIQVLFAGLFALLALFAALTLYSSLSVQRLQQRVREAEQFGQYTLVRKLGEGGVGKVYLARHALLKRPTAVKVLDPQQINAQTLARFEREVQLVAELSHPNTIRIYDFGRTPEGVFYYAMEYLDGMTLADLIKTEGPLPAGRVIHIIKQVCESLQEAHEAGLIHRDIKPLNLMLLCRRGIRYDVVKVLDFGLVKQLDNPDTRELTGPAQLFGTPMYLAPERIRDPQLADPRVDIYALGAVMFCLLTAQEVFEADGNLDVLYRTMNEPPRRPSQVVKTPIPGTLDRLVVDCLAKDPENRPAGMVAVLQTLDSVDAPPWRQADAKAWWLRRPAHPARHPTRNVPAGQDSCR